MKSPSYFLFYAFVISTLMLLYYFVAIRKWVFMYSEIQKLYIWSFLAAMSSSVTILFSFQDVDFVFRGYLFCLVSLCFYLLSLCRPSARHSALFRALVVYPAHYAISAAFYVLPFAFIYIFYPDARRVAVLPFFAAFFSVFLSIIPPRDDTLHVIADLSRPCAELCRVKATHISPEGLKPDLVVYQIADTHIGAFCTAEDVEAICTKAVDSRPDLIVITGDMMSFEANLTSLEQALRPLRRYSGKVVACWGDRDQHPEAKGIMRNVYGSVGVKLLEDEQTVVELSDSRGTVTVIGSVYQTPENSERYTRMLLDAEKAAESEESGKNIRVLLGHDPTIFQSVRPEDKIDLVLSGHTHGGFYGIQGVTSATWALFKMPDNGVWRKDRSHLYVHRGQGISGFPLRLGLWSETGLMLEDQTLEDRIKLVDRRQSQLEDRIIYQKIATAAPTVEKTFEQLKEKFKLIPDSIDAPCWGYYDLQLKRKADIDVIEFSVDYGRHGMIRVDYFCKGPSAKVINHNKEDKT